MANDAALSEAVHWLVLFSALVSSSRLLTYCSPDDDCVIRLPVRPESGWYAACAKLPWKR